MIDELLSYPELVAAAAIAVVVPASASVSDDFYAPDWISKPAVAFFKSLPVRYWTFVQQQLTWANLRELRNLNNFCTAKFVLGLVLLFSSLAFNPMLILLGALIGYLLPDAVLSITVRKRQGQIRQALPQALDLMVMCVDAGLALDATVQRISMEQSAIGHALNEELTFLGRDLLLGTERERAYQFLYQRTGVDELKFLGSALNQSAKMGLSIANILRSQSEYLRLRQSQAAEERALKLPIYMAFPMWFCIMPALLTIVLAPSIISFLGQVGRL